MLYNIVNSEIKMNIIGINHYFRVINKIQRIINLIFDNYVDKTIFTYIK